MSECRPSREVGRRNRETGAVAGGPLGTKPFLKSQYAGWLNGGPRHRWCSADTGSARKCDYVWVKPWLRLPNLLLMIITITGLGPGLTKMHRMGSNTTADLSAAKLTHALLFLLHLSWQKDYMLRGQSGCPTLLFSPHATGELDVTSRMYAWV